MFVLLQYWTPYLFNQTVINFRAGPGPTVAQVDLAPTIAWLLNAPPPGDSAGRILPSLIPIDMRQHLYLLHVIASHNAKQGVPTDLGKISLNLLF